MSQNFTELSLTELDRQLPDDPSDTRLDGIDPSFVFDFRSYDEPDDTDQRWSTWHSVEPLCRGPEPRPDWVVT